MNINGYVICEGITYNDSRAPEGIHFIPLREEDGSFKVFQNFEEAKTIATKFANTHNGKFYIREIDFSEGKITKVKRSGFLSFEEFQKEHQTLKETILTKDFNSENLIKLAKLELAYPEFTAEISD